MVLGSLTTFTAIRRASSWVSPAEFRNKLLTRIPVFWLRSLLCPNWKYVLD